MARDREIPQIGLFKYCCQGKIRLMSSGQVTDMLGLLNVHKPVGVTSRDAVTHVQRLLKPLKVGHAGTLDPLASGVLVIGIGKATRLMKYVQRMPKLYRASFRLGFESDTEDILGQVRQVPETSVPTHDQILERLPRFIGEIQQRPPAFSALKVKGQRAYALARKGQDVVLEPRPVQVYDIQLEHYAFPQLQLTISCGTGTYVRSLGRDLAQDLGTAAVMESLVRCSIGSFKLDQSLTLDSLGRQEISRHLLPAGRAVEDLPSVVLEQDLLDKVELGQLIQLPPSSQGPEIALRDRDNNLLAILVESGSGCWRPSPNLIAR